VSIETCVVADGAEASLRQHAASMLVELLGETKVEILTAHYSQRLAHIKNPNDPQGSREAVEVFLDEIDERLAVIDHDAHEIAKALAIIQSRHGSLVEETRGLKALFGDVGVATEEAELFDQQLWIEDNLGRALAKMMDRISSSGLSISGIDKLLTRRNKTLMEYATQVMQKRFGA